MKCITDGTVIKRVSNEQAEKQVESGWKFTTRKEWKKKVRDAK